MLLSCLGGLGGQAPNEQYSWRYSRLRTNRDNLDIKKKKTGFAALQRGTSSPLMPGIQERNLASPNGLPACNSSAAATHTQEGVMLPTTARPVIFTFS